MARSLKVHSRKKFHLGAHLFLIVICALLLLPILFTFFYSFFPKTEMKAYLELRGNYDQKWMPLLVVPKLFSLRQYYTILIEDPTYLRYFVNSVGYAVAILLGQAVFIPSMAYALSAFRFRGREVVFFLLLILMLMPFQVTMMPNVIILRFMGLLDTPWAVILPMWFAPFYVFLLRQFMVAIPGDMFEAGMMDGCGPIRAYFHVMLPVCRPVLGAAVALSFADNWNLFEQPFTYLSQDQLKPLSVIFNQLSDARQDIAFAGAALFMLPMLFIYFYFQEDILLGIQLSELK